MGSAATSCDSEWPSPTGDANRIAAAVADAGLVFAVGLYNFTDFSEDLTDLSFRSEGVFINMIGSM